MSRVIAAFIDNARTVLFLLAFLLIAGYSSYVSIPKESVPDIQIPIVIVTVRLDGVSPEDAERLIVRPIERAVASLDGVKEMTSTAFQGGGNVVLEFDAGTDIDLVKAEVRVKIDEVKEDFPEEAFEPKVDEVNLSLFPVLIIHLSGEIPDRALYKLARDLRDQIESDVSTVLEVNILGDREEVVEIIIDPVKLEGYGFSIEQVLNLVLRNNQLISAGDIDTGQGRMAIKVPGLIETAQDILSIPLKTEGQTVVKFADVASIRRTYRDPGGYARNFGKPTVALEIVKRTGENIIQTVSEVRASTAKVTKDWPESIKVRFSQDQSERIEFRLNELQNSLILAVLLVMLVIFRSLGWRSSLLVGLAVPGSFLIGILIISFLGLTMNIVVLFGLIMAVGMLVDGAIIVVEFADRKMAEGLDRKEAYKKAATRMLWPVVASISTTLAVFSPLLFWPGIVGEFMKFLPLTLIATLSASIAMAIIFIPTLGALVGKVAQGDKEKIKSTAAAETGSLDDIKGFTRWYVDMLDTALKRPGKVILSAIGILIGVFVLYGFLGKGVEFFPDIDPDSAIIKIQARGNISVEEKDEIVRKVEERILDMDDFLNLYSNSDYGTSNSRNPAPRNITRDTVGVINLELKDWQERRPVNVVLDDLRERLRDLPGIKATISVDKPGPTADKPVQIELSGLDYDVLNQAAKKLRDHMEGVEGLTGIEDNLDIPGIDWEVKVNRSQAAKFGADVVLIGSTIRLVTNGFKLDEYRPEDSRDEVDIIVRYPEDNRTLDDLKDIKIQTNRGLVPISSFITITPKPKIGRIKRTDGQRTLKISAAVLPGYFATNLVAELDTWLKAPDSLPSSISYSFKGDQEDQDETSSFLTKAGAFALFLVAVILVAQFNSFFNMLLILSSVIMSTIGVFVGLLVMDQAFSIVMGGIGIIALAGIIVSNNIIFLDTYERLKDRIKDQHEAILRTGAQRLRPVILTQLTTVLGLTPIMFSINIDFLAFEISQGAPSNQWWLQLSSAIVFGLLFASALTLIVTPCAVMLRHRFAQWRAKKRAL